MATTTGFRERVSLLSVAAITASEAGAAIYVDRFDRAQFFLDMTSAATVAADKLDVYIQILLPDGSTWHDLCAFTQIDGNGAASQELLQWSEEGQPDVEQGAVVTAALAESTVLQGGMTGSQIRAYAKVTNDTTPIFSCTVTANFAEPYGSLL